MSSWIVLTLAISFGPLWGVPRDPGSSLADEAARMGVHLHWLHQPEPTGVFVDTGRQIWTTSAVDHRVRVWSAEGKLLRAWGARGAGVGELLDPQGIGVAGDRVYVVDSGNHRIQVFDLDGKPRGRWGQHGDGFGEFRRPRGLAVTSDRVFVADTENHRIQIFDRDGRLLSGFGRRGNGGGEFNRPWDVTVDREGNVYVVDSENHRVQRFEPDGTHTSTWGGFGFQPGLFSTPRGIDYHGDRLWVSDSRNHRVQVFDRQGRFRQQWGGHGVRPREGPGLLHYPGFLAFDPSGEFIVVNEPFEDRGQIFGPARPGGVVENPEWFGIQTESHYGPRLSIDGNLLAVTQPDTHAVLLFDISRIPPTLLTRWGGFGGKAGYFRRPAGVALDASRQRIVVSDLGNRRLQAFRFELPEEKRFTPFVTRFVKSVVYSRVPAERGPVTETTAVVAGPDGRLYAIDPVLSTVVVFDRDLRLVATWGGWGTAPGRLNLPTDLAFGSRGERVFVVDRLNFRIQAFDLEGKHRFHFGHAGDARGRFLLPFGIAARDGDLYVTDQGRHRVLRFDEKGKFVQEWGGSGIGAGELHRPAGIAFTPDRIVVIDHGNHRGQVFSSNGKFVDVFGARWYTAPAK